MSRQAGCIVLYVSEIELMLSLCSRVILSVGHLPVESRHC